jgi:hypothetical protein
MMRHVHRLVLLGLLLGGAPSVAGETPSNAWSCSAAFHDMVEKLEADYIGLRLLGRDGPLSGYEERKAAFAEKCAVASGETCTKVLGSFLEFLGDGHLFVFERPEYDAAELAAFTKQARTHRPGRDELVAMLSQDRAPRGIVGRWTDGRSEIAIVGTGDRYRAYLLDPRVEGAETGDLKAEITPTESGFEGTYYSYEHAPRYVTARLHKEGTLLSFGAVLWAKLDSRFTRESAMVDPSDPSRPTLARLNEDTTLLSIPSFLIDYNEFRAFLKKHDKILDGSRNLVIDIRGNTGGNGIYFPLIEYFADRTLPASQGLVLASPDTLAYFRNQNAKIYARVASNIENHMGAIVDGPAYPEKKLKPARNKIERVAILADGGCMSAAESFILHARALSSRVKTFGSPTAGVIDYTSVNALKLPSGTRNIYFGYPTSTYNKQVPDKGYNDTGIVPDIPIDPEVEDKVAFVLGRLE